MFGSGRALARRAVHEILKIPGWLRLVTYVGLTFSVTLIGGMANPWIGAIAAGGLTLFVGLLALVEERVSQRKLKTLTERLRRLDRPTFAEQARDDYERMRREQSIRRLQGRDYGG